MAIAVDLVVLRGVGVRSSSFGGLSYLRSNLGARADCQNSGGERCLAVWRGFALWVHICYRLGMITEILPTRLRFCKLLLHRMQYVVW